MTATKVPDSVRLQARLELLSILRCRECGGVGFQSGETADCLQCRQCASTIPVRAGIPRMVDAPAADVARRTQDSFGYEWTEFSDWRQSGDLNFREYFTGLDPVSVRSQRVLDAGCGMGRHARFMADLARVVVAVDFSSAIDSAARNVSDKPNVQCVQADITALPFADNTFDYVYSIGVLHHIDNTPGALASVVRKARPGGRVRVYLYWKRHGWSGALLRAVTLLRRVTTRMPLPTLKLVCWPLSVALSAVAVMPYRLFDRAGFKWHRTLPLYAYAKYPFAILYNDQFDRLSAPLEQRFDREEVRAMMQHAGLQDVTVYPHFGWIAEGVR
jgi:ubiquinone/menaquinone biosynthesis C-methylase UbiE/uncharacterized protein YbaR (Trm112 family)